ncbi:MAG: DUF116 domain-containing protein [Clostridiaceae bacterium]|nr:DUF116 domain-containing protein [Clostridiaceae bacterium]
MEIDRKFYGNNSHKMFTFLLMIMLTFVLAISAILFYLASKESPLLYQVIIMGSTIFLSVIAMLILLTIFALMLLWYNKKIPRIIKVIMEISINTSYPIIMTLGQLLKYDKNTIRGAYTNLNNQLVLSTKYSVAGENILILTPHCIQKSFCPHKITTDVYNCKRCSLCNVDKLLEFREKYGVHFNIVTGGTLARKMIVDIRPKAIIAIACERDLLSGLMDVKKVPILAIVNKRPEGPCVNTHVDLKEVEKAILHFIKE